MAQVVRHDPCYDGPATASTSKPACTRAQERRLGSLYLWEEDRYASLSRAWHTALVVVGTDPVKACCTSGSLFTFGVRPWFDLPAATSTAQRATACQGVSWGGGVAHKLVARTRRAALAVVGLDPYEERCTDRRLVSFGVRPWCDVPAAASNTKPACACDVRKRDDWAHCPGRGGAARKLVARACRAALVVVDLDHTKGRCIGRRLVSSGARPWGDVSAAVSNAKPACACARERPLGSLSLGRRRWVWPA